MTHSCLWPKVYIWGRWDTSAPVQTDCNALSAFSVYWIIGHWSHINDYCAFSERRSASQDGGRFSRCVDLGLLCLSVYAGRSYLVLSSKILWLTRLLRAGVSIISKNWVFYKGWYLRLEFFISRVNLVFYKKEVVFYKRSPFLIKIADFVNFSIFKGKYLLVWNEYIDSLCLITLNTMNLPDLIPVYVNYPLLIQCWKIDCHSKLSFL